MASTQVAVRLLYLPLPSGGPQPLREAYSVLWDPPGLDRLYKSKCIVMNLSIDLAFFSGARLV